MKKIAAILFIMSGILFVGCAKTPQDNYYDRATNSSQQAIENLDRE
jgi:hypothetical protein